MNKITTSNTPEISMVDKSGIQWNFDLNAGQWSAIVDGKKISSKDLEKLKTKVQARTAPADNKSKQAPKVNTVEVALVLITTKRHGFAEYDEKLNLSKLEFKPILAKMEWNGKKNAMEIVRYKEKDSGWKSYKSDSLIVFHPQFMTPNIKSVIAKSIESTMVEDAFSRTEKAVATAWWNAKSDNTTNWAIEYQKGLVKTNRGPSMGDSSSFGYTSPLWRLYENENNTDFSDWTKQEDGSLRLGDIIVRMELNEKLSSWPSFKIYSPHQDEPIGSFSDLSVALILGRASHMISTSPSQIINQWAGPKDLARSGSVDWPSMRTIHGAAIFSGLKDEYSNKEVPYVYILRESSQKNGFGEPTVKDGEPALSWGVRDSYGQPSYRLAGPEDAHLDTLARLKAQKVSLTKNRQLHPKLADVIGNLSEETISVVCGEVENGEDLTNDFDTMSNLLDKLYKNTLARITTDENIVQWNATCEQVKNDIINSLNQPSPAPPKGPKASRM